MMTYQPTAGEMRTMSIDDIFLSRLKLLIIMAKAYLKNYPIGKYRKSAAIENAHHVFYHSLQLTGELERQPDMISEIDIEEERVFHRKVRLLSVMVKAVAEDRLTENIREKALKDILNRICDILTSTFHIKDEEFLKVA